MSQIASSRMSRSTSSRLAACPPVLVRLLLSSCLPRRFVRSRRDRPPEGPGDCPQPCPGAFDVSGFEIVDGRLDGRKQLGWRRPPCYTATRVRFSGIFRRSPTHLRFRPRARFFARNSAPDRSHILPHNGRTHVRLLSAVEHSWDSLNAGYISSLGELSAVDDFLPAGPFSDLPGSATPSASFCFSVSDVRCRAHFADARALPTPA